VAQVGQVLGDRYRLVELLGQGGMATIFRAYDNELGREVAVKVLRAEYGRDSAFVARFRQEAQSAAALSHPNVVNVFDYGMENGDPFIVMELVEGGDLAGAIKEQGALGPLAAGRIGQQIFDALNAAHGRGIIHRDIKPTNVLLTRAGQVKVADFGIARAFSEAQLTMPGTTLGSVHYFSPEQARGELVTSASDVYSAGLVLFEMLTGRRAWTGDSAGAVAVARLAGDPPAPSSMNQAVPPALDTIVRRALARAPSDRPTAAEVSQLLGQYIADPAGAQPVAPAPVPVPVPHMPTMRQDAYGSSPTYGTTSRRSAAARPRTYREEEEEESRGAPWGWIAGILGVLVLIAAGILLFVLLSGRGPGPGASPGQTPVFVQMPNFVGQLLPAARQQAIDAGLSLTVGAFERTTDVPENQVIAQDPQAGGQAQRGSEVTVTVATSEVTTVVPDLRLRTEAELERILTENQLVRGVRIDAHDAAVPSTLVASTNPRFGVEVAFGTAVDYVLSLGPEPTPSPTPTLEPGATPGTPAPPVTPEVIVITPGPPPTPELIVITPPPAPAPVTLGNFTVGDTVGSAIAVITDPSSGLQLGVVWPPAGQDTWVVCSQAPGPGEVPPGTVVHLFAVPPEEACP
jgi:serine/threonine protein kinase